jgi:hypothetical protein
MIVRSHLPWPLRWVVVALMLGFSAALALWAFEFGKEIAGLDRDATQELQRLRVEVEQLRKDADQARSTADTAASLVKAEQAAQQRLAQQVRQLEADKQALQSDLGFFEQLLPAGSEGPQVRGLLAESAGPGQLRFQMLLMQSGKAESEFKGRVEITLGGMLEGRHWTLQAAGGARPVQFKLYARLEGKLDHPPAAVIKTVQARILDSQGAVRASQTTRI